MILEILLLYSDKWWERAILFYEYQAQLCSKMFALKKKIVIFEDPVW
jgi:hypothetical protein